MTNEEFIAQNRDADIRALALGKVPSGIDLQYCLRQIEGQQIVRRKLPSWTKKEGIIYPPKLSLEQCSSEQTALYKQKLVERLLPGNRQKMVDLTGGFGIDFSVLAQLFDESVYVELSEELCKIAQHNFPLLGLPKARIHCKACEEYIDEMGDFSLIYLDPSRRDNAGRKVVALSACAPSIETIQDDLLEHAPIVVVKLSPMLDIQDTIRRLPNVNEVHTVSVGGECKEILLVLCREKVKITYYCTNITARTQTFCTDTRDTKPIIASNLENYLYEPNASIMKAGCFQELAQHYNVQPLAPNSHLFVSEQPIADFPGRSFQISAISSMNKKELKTVLSNIHSANITVRNFPLSVADLRKKLKLADGGNVYIFATTLANNQHVLIVCRVSEG